METKFEELISSFIENKIGISDHFISAALAGRLRENLMNLDKEDQMKMACIGNKLLKDPEQKKRGDKIFWIDNRTQDISERALLNQIDQFIVYLNDSCYTSINAYEFHYALYETGSSYSRHKDQFQDNRDRKFSLVHYLNTDWLIEDGGELLIYQGDRTKKIHPHMQKAVFFQSSHTEHEVSKASRPRMSITGWLKSI